MNLGVKPKYKHKFRLVKWEAEQAPENPVARPEDDPRCVEVIEWELGKPKKIIYQRN